MIIMMARCTSICAKNSWCTGTKGCIPQQEVLLVYYSWHKELAPCNCFKSGYHWVHFMVLWSHNRRESKEPSPFVLLMGCRPLPSCTGTLHPLIILTFHTLFQSQHLPQKRWWSKLCLEYQLWKNHRFVQQQDDVVFKTDLFFLLNHSLCFIWFFDCY